MPVCQGLVYEDSEVRMCCSKTLNAGQCTCGGWKVRPTSSDWWTQCMRGYYAVSLTIGVVSHSMTLCHAE